MKRIVAMLLTAIMVMGLAGCSGDSGSSAPPAGDGAAAAGDGGDGGATHSLNVSGLDGSLTMLPVWIAEQKGWFEDAGLTINRTGFTNGPVQMEAIDSWDIGLTGIGGVLSGSINYDAVLIATVGTDDGTQYLYVRPDTPVAQAGQGGNRYSDEIYGDAESWKGMSVNCTYGNVLHFLLLKTLDGFGLTVDDVEVNWMDMATSNASLLAGEGDAACVSGEVSFTEDKDNFVMASNGDLAGLGLLTNIMANPDAFQDPEVRAATKVFLKVFFETVDWMNANKDETVEHLIDWCDYGGNSVDERVAEIYLTVDTYYTLERNYDAFHTDATDGGDYNSVQESVLNILNFFIDTGNYQEGDDQLLLKPEHIDTSLIDELHGEVQ